MPPKKSKATAGSSSASVSSSGSGSGDNLLRKAKRRSKRITVAAASAYRDGVRIERSVRKLCEKVTILEDRVSVLESQCGTIREEMAGMVQREVREQMKTLLDQVEKQVVSVFENAKCQ